MKQLALILIFSIGLLSTSMASEKKNEQTVKFSVSMDCHNCVKKIEANIPYEKGVKDLKVSLDEKECTVTFRTDKTSKEALIKAFEKLGYKAEEKTVQHDKANNAGHEGHNHN